MPAPTNSWVVIENTPGYLPDDDEPFVTDDLSAAIAHAAELADYYREHDDWEYDVEGSDDGMSYYVSERDNPRDLGRVIEVLPCEPETEV